MQTATPAVVDEAEGRERPSEARRRLRRGWLRRLLPTARRTVRIAAAFVALFTLTALVGAFWVLDRFVIASVQIADVAAYEAEFNATTTIPDLPTASANTTPAADASTAGLVVPTITDDSYVADGISITIEEVSTGSGNDRITYYVADVVLSDATSLRSAFAENAFGTNIVEFTSDIARDNGAVFAVNGDYYGFRDTGIMIRNGIPFRDEGTRTGLAIYRDGTMAIYDETQTTADDLVAAGVWNTLSFGPALLDGGDVVDRIEHVEVDGYLGKRSIQGQQPRTGVGMIEAGHFVFVVVDGRSPGYSEGMSMTEFAELFSSLGCEVAYNLDGGGSATMYFNGSVVNDPLGRGDERGTSDILYIGS